MKLDPFVHIQVVRLVQIVDKEMASKCGANWQKTQARMMCSSMQRCQNGCLPIIGYICALVRVPFARREGMTEEPH
ncbi:hypothetical protein MUK42_30790 [Musa troglodytarum]|uniref:Uncharacterized protein n=1 Tax=Musa troglodytarum TaxID=320322 RepID=A0A9E7FGQ7_9LILI|nr:hypothetical protein MUK42_30790 [Musa troglodytarum]